MRATVERRQFRRAEMTVPVVIRPVGDDGSKAAPISGQARNVSLAGVYCYVPASCSLKADDSVTCSVSVPRDQTRTFPFTRVVGKGWIVRSEPVQEGRRAGDSHGNESQVALAIAFAPDVTALGTLAE